MARSFLKPHIKFWNGSWWCRRMGITGQGATPRQAFDDYWLLYRQTYKPNPPAFYRPIRAG